MFHTRWYSLNPTTVIIDAFCIVMGKQTSIKWLQQCIYDGKKEKHFSANVSAITQRAHCHKQ